MNDLALTITPERICLRTPFFYKEVCRSVPGARWDPTAKHWYWPNDALAAEGLLDAFGPKLAALPEADALRRIHGIAPEPQAIMSSSGTWYPEIPNLAGASWGHQLAGYHFCHGKPGSMLAFDMGLGKSRVAVGLIRNRALLTLILCPKSVVPVWPREFQKHLAMPESVLVLPLDKGSVREKTAQAQKALRSRAPHRPLVLVINFESAWREPFASFALAAGFDALVMDEIHKIKAPGGKASRFCARLAQVCPFRLGLSGTPMAHSPLDLYAQCRALNPAVFGTNYHQFMTRYAIMGGFEGRSVIGYTRQKELHDKFFQIAIKAGKELLDLPPEQDVTIPVELSPAALKILRDLERDFYTELEAGEITASNALVKLLRQQQVTSGRVRLDGGAIKEVDSGKHEALCDLLDGLGDEPAVVFSRFTADLDAVAESCAALKLEYRELSGRKNTLQEWQQGQGQVIGVNIQAGGAGIDLTRARYCIYYSLGFSLGDYMQSRARVHRPGQTRPVTYYHLVADKTVDAKVYAALAARKEVVDYILGLNSNEQPVSVNFAAQPCANS